MPRVVVDVMLKPEILDPQGQAVANALPRLGVADVSAVRVGRHIEIEFVGEPDLDQVRDIAGRFLANPVIEEYTLSIPGDGQVSPNGLQGATVPATVPGPLAWDTAEREQPPQEAPKDQP